MQVAVTAEEVKERCPPKAMVKPQLSKVSYVVVITFWLQIVAFGQWYIYFLILGVNSRH